MFENGRYYNRQQRQHGYLEILGDFNDRKIVFISKDSVLKQ